MTQTQMQVVGINHGLPGLGIVKAWRNGHRELLDDVPGRADGLGERVRH